jgi:hypothetical protein
MEGESVLCLNGWKIGGELCTRSPSRPRIQGPYFPFKEACNRHIVLNGPSECVTSSCLEPGFSGTGL